MADYRRRYPDRARRRRAPQDDVLLDSDRGGRALAACLLVIALHPVHQDETNIRVLQDVGGVGVGDELRSWTAELDP